MGQYIGQKRVMLGVDEVLMWGVIRVDIHEWHHLQAEHPSKSDITIYAM